MNRDLYQNLLFKENFRMHNHTVNREHAWRLRALEVFPTFKDMYAWLISLFKLFLGVNVCVCEWLFILSASDLPLWCTGEWWPVQSVLYISSNDCWSKSSPFYEVYVSWNDVGKKQQKKKQQHILCPHRGLWPNSIFFFFHAKISH